jgi:hypothetical protein
MKTRYIAIGVLVALIVLLCFPRCYPPTGRPGPSLPSSGEAGIASPVPAKPVAPAVPIATQLDDICAKLKATKDPAVARKLLAQLREVLNALPHEVASREIRKFLATGDDAATNLDLTVQPGGHLGDASSLRVFLLDYLGSVDPAAAGAIAMQILARSTTPDEWAVSLRNYAWAHPDATDCSYLQQKDRELLANPAWVKNPSAGYLEAFDAIVYARDTAVTPQLAGLLRDTTNRAAGYAAYLTLDRLVIAEPKTMLRTLVDQPGLLKGREKTRADFVARADLAQPDERALVEKYLLDPKRDPQERAQFAGSYPNFNYMLSDNLMSHNETANRDIMVQRDRSSLAVVEQWENDPRFADLQPALATMHARLANFVQQAAPASP